MTLRNKKIITTILTKLLTIKLRFDIDLSIDLLSIWADMKPFIIIMFGFVAQPYATVGVLMLNSQAVGQINFMFKELLKIEIHFFSNTVYIKTN